MREEWCGGDTGTPGGDFDVDSCGDNSSIIAYPKSYVCNEYSSPVINNFYIDANEEEVFLVLQTAARRVPTAVSTPLLPTRMMWLLLGSVLVMKLVRMQKRLMSRISARRELCVEGIFEIGSIPLA